MKHLTSASAVIDALGGTGAVARISSRREQAVANWRTRGLPPETYVVLTAELEKIGKTAPASLWRMVEPERAAS